MFRVSRSMKTLAAAAFAVGLATTAQASAVITNGIISLGVNDLAQLNVGSIGLTFNATGNESTAPGCACEGWGAADASTGLTGFANNSAGIAGVSLVSFTPTASTATSIVDIAGGGQAMRVTHAYFPAPETPNLYEAVVTIENTGAAPIGDLRYRRTMDWDIEPTAFSEFVTVVGAGASSSVLGYSDDGFESSDPLSSLGSINFAFGPGGPDVIDSGPNDHGANFDFGFGALGIGESTSFSIYYGAAATEDLAEAALAAVGAEMFSLGQCNSAGNASCSEITGAPNTFIFAFSGVGGEVIFPTDPTDPPSGIPEPATLTLFGAGLLGLGWARRRRTAA